MELNSQMFDPSKVENDLRELTQRLYPICRSITGKGVRKTLGILQQHLPLLVKEIPTGTQIFDWQVPMEWNIRDAWIKDPNGRKIVDFKHSNLHILNYSIPIKESFPLEDLNRHLYSLPEQPTAIPYRTSYYQPQWGFCISQQLRQSLEPGMYEVCIDSTLTPGHLTYGEYQIQGVSSKEFLFTTHICHPSMANDNVSGMVVMALVAKLLSQSKPYYSHRFLFIPGTIGSIAWLATNQDRLKDIKGGVVLSGLGNADTFHYQCSRKGDSVVDRICTKLLEKGLGEIRDFIPYGYDERQFSSPGINLPMGNLSRSVWGSYPEYHTSHDNLEFISVDRLAGSVELILKIISELDRVRFYQGTVINGEPQLGKRGLYHTIGGQDIRELQLAMLWVLNFSDGNYDLEAIALKSGMEASLLQKSIDALIKAKLLVQQ